MTPKKCMFWVFALATNMASATLTCPENTYASSGAVLAFNPSAGAETFDRSIPTEVDLGPVQWNVLNNGGVTLVAKIKFSASPTRYERVFAATDSATAGNALFQIMRRDQEEKMFFIFNDGDTNCVSPDIAITNEQWISMKFWFNSATNNMEVQLNDGDIYSTDCSAVSGFFAQDRLQNVNIFGRHGGSSPHFHGAVAGFYGFNSYLSAEAVDSVLNSIVVGGPDKLPTLQCCAADGSYTPECGCQESFYKNLKPVSAEIHMNTGVNKNWDDAYAAAAAAGTRLFTCTELKEYLQQNGPIDANSGLSWVACTGSASCSGKDFMQAGPSQSDRITGQLHQDDKGWGCLGTTRYQSTQIFMFYVPETFECAACPTDGTIPPTSKFSFEEGLLDETGNAEIQKIAGTGSTFVSDATHGQVLNVHHNLYRIDSATLGAMLDANAFTVSFWIRLKEFESSVSNANLLLSRYDWNVGDNRGGFILWINAKKIALKQYYGPNTTPHEVESTQELSILDNWYHITLVKVSSTESKIFIDGNLDNSFTFSPAAKSMHNPIDVIGLGAYCYGNTGNADGYSCAVGSSYDDNSKYYMNDLRFYEFAASDTQVAAIASGGDISVCSSSAEPEETDCQVSISYWSIRKSTCP